MFPRKRYTITPERLAEFEQREGEDDYAWISRQISMARGYELVWLFMIRDDRQRQAMQLATAYREAWWTRFASVAALVTSVLATVVALVAILANT